jgi:error-prone DNA polymerase
MDGPRSSGTQGPPPYVELHCHSAFSFLDGTSDPSELAATAAEFGYPALALTDHDGLWGSMEFAHACKGFGIRPITGAEVTVGAEEASHLTLLVENAAGYRNLCRILSAAHRHTRDNRQREAGQPSVAMEEVERLSEGLVCLSGCAGEGALAGRWERGRLGEAEGLGRRLLNAFGSERFRVELQRPYWRRDRARNRWLASLAERLGVPCVATGDVHCHDRRRSHLQDAFVAVRLGATLEASEPARRGNSASVLCTPAAMADRFRDHPGAVAESARLAERLRFDLTSELGYRYPGAEDPGADHRLAELCRELLEDRYAGRRERREALGRLEEELRIIRSLRLSGFFLLHRDMLELAREVAAEVRGPESARSVLPPGRGRGSSVSSIVCYLTGLSHIDPVKAGLFPGRFLNEEISAVPDIDLDFPRDIREKLIPRVHERYGTERSALVAAFPTYRPKGVVRDLGKVLGLPPAEIERVARMVDYHGGSEALERDVTVAIGERAESVRWRRLIEIGGEALGLPRHASQHPGGMVLSTQPLVEICPVVPAAMEGRQIAQWDKDSCADAGFLKIDLLGLGMLSAVERCVEEVARSRGERLDLSRIPLDDQKTYEAIRRAETTGVFQIESRAQMQMLPRTLPQDLDDLTVQVALVRPGPIQGGAIHPYIERRRLLREVPGYEVPYEHPSLRPVLEETLGAIVFQEQVIEVAMALAGFGAGEAEGLRRAMSRKRSEAAILAYRERFIDGAVERGASRTVAESVFAQIEGFSGFGFPKAHSAAFALLAYQSAWLREHRGPEFLCSLLNEQPMGFYPPDALVHEAQRRGIDVFPPDVNRSRVLCHVECLQGGRPFPTFGVRVGLGYVNGVVEDEMETLVDQRKNGGAYGGIADIASRSGVGRDGLERLAWAGALDELEPAGRRATLWRLGTARGSQRIPAGTQLALSLEAPAAPELPALGRWERVLADYRSTGMTLGEHPMELLRDELGRDVALGIELERTRDGSAVEVAGLVVARQRPATAKGVVFMLLEDESGTVNLVIPPPVFERHRAEVRTAPLVRAAGRLERRQGAINVVISRLARLERPDLPLAEVRTIEEPIGRGIERNRHGDWEAIPEELAAVAPAAHSFGRRGR